MKIDHRQTLLLLAGVASVALWAIPVFGLVTLPLVYLNTHLHELSHALAAVLTGGSVANIHVFSSGNGVTLIGGGMPLIYGSAGYIGASLFGAAMIAMSAKPKGAKTMLRVLGLLLGLGLIVWVRGDLVGLISGASWAILLWILAGKLEGAKAVFWAQFLGMQQCLMSVQALWVLYRINAVAGIENDAKIVGDLTHLPPLLWATLWCAISLLAMAAALRAAWRGGPNRSGG